MTITIQRVTSPVQLASARAVRRQVFIGEQGVTEAEELDGLDEEPTTRHVLAVDGAHAVGTARLLQERPGLVHIGRVAVLPALRGRGVGALLMAALEEMALAESAGEDGSVRIELSAQVTAIEFYRRLGYQIAPQQYLDARIWHQDAHKTLLPWKPPRS